MPTDAVRIAAPAYNPALQELERDNYFIRSRLYGNDHTLVAEDQSKGLIFGVIAATLKEVSIGGSRRKAAFFYDLRVHPDYRRSVLDRRMRSTA